MRQKDPRVFVRGQGVEEWLKMLWNAWSRKFPKRAAAFIEHIKEQKQNLVVASGMSRDKTMAYTGSIPTDLYLVITAKYPTFFNSPLNMELAHQIFCGDYRPKRK